MSEFGGGSEIGSSEVTESNESVESISTVETGGELSDASMESIENDASSTEGFEAGAETPDMESDEDSFESDKDLSEMPDSTNEAFNSEPDLSYQEDVDDIDIDDSASPDMDYDYSDKESEYMNDDFSDPDLEYAVEDESIDESGDGEVVENTASSEQNQIESEFEGEADPANDMETSGEVSEEQNVSEPLDAIDDENMDTDAYEGALDDSEQDEDLQYSINDDAGDVVEEYDDLDTDEEGAFPEESGDSNDGLFEDLSAEGEKAEKQDQIDSEFEDETGLFNDTEISEEIPENRDVDEPLESPDDEYMGTEEYEDASDESTQYEDIQDEVNGDADEAEKYDDLDSSSEDIDEQQVSVENDDDFEDSDNYEVDEEKLAEETNESEADPEESGDINEDNSPVELSVEGEEESREISDSQDELSSAEDIEDVDGDDLYGEDDWSDDIENENAGDIEEVYDDSDLDQGTENNGADEYDSEKVDDSFDSSGVEIDETEEDIPKTEESPVFEDVSAQDDLDDYGESGTETDDVTGVDDDSLSGDEEASVSESESPLDKQEADNPNTDESDLEKDGNDSVAEADDSGENNLEAESNIDDDYYDVEDSRDGLSADNIDTTEDTDTEDGNEINNEGEDYSSSLEDDGLANEEYDTGDAQEHIESEESSERVDDKADNKEPIVDDADNSSKGQDNEISEANSEDKSDNYTDEAEGSSPPPPGGPDGSVCSSSPDGKGEGENRPPHTFKDWVNPDNYENGKYIGEDQDWGYKPYGEETSALRDSIENSPESRMSAYMSEHGYGSDDYAEYSQDSEWRNVNVELQNASDETNHPKYSYRDEINEKGYATIPASDIQGVDSSDEHFWDHHGSSKEDFTEIASKLPDVQEQLDNGATIEEIRENPDLKLTVDAYYDPDNMVVVENTEDNFRFQDDGRHRVAAAQELGYDVPVKVAEVPSEQGNNETFEKFSGNFNDLQPMEGEGGYEFNDDAYEVDQGDSADMQSEEKPEGETKGAFFDNVSYRQGQNDFGAYGTCGPTSIANSLNRVTESSNYSENAVLHNAMDSNLCSRSHNPMAMGGTTTKDIVSIVDNVKDLESNIHTEVYDYDKSLSVDELADRLEGSGAAAIVGVDSATLWDQRGNVSSSGLFRRHEAPSDHWITVDSPVRDENGKVTGFNIIDSGGGESFVDRDKFERMYKGDENHRVSDPTAILVSNKGEAVNIYDQPAGVERAANYKGGKADISSGNDSPRELREVKIENTERTLSGAELSARQQEINNTFRGDNFDAEKSFEGKVPEERRNELIDANSKTTCGFKENLDGSCDDMKYGASFSPEQKEKLSELNDLRKSIPEIKEDTIMQKVITPDQMKQYLEGGKTNVTGCASRAEDVAPYTNNLEQAYETLRLDYHGDGTCFDGNDFNKAIQNGEGMYVLRFTTDYSPSNDTFPKVNEFTKPPCTGTGYTGSEKHLVPEYTYSMDENGEYNGAGHEITNGAIYKIDKDGKETMIGYWNSNLGRFSEVK